MAASIKDIARQAGVSYSTVSRALSNSPRVKAETRHRIQQLAAEMGYLPSAVARSLVTRRTMTLGVVVSTITDLFFAEVIQSIEETALQYKYQAIVASSNGERLRELEAIRALLERRVDGIILVSACCRREDLAGNGPDVPVVSINNLGREHLGYSIEVDDVDGGRQATRHLLALGHRRIAHITGPSEDWDSVERREGYTQELQAWGVPVDSSLIVHGGNRPPDGVRAMERLLTLRPRPTAVFCYNDAVALGAMRAAYAAGLRIPQHLSVVGFDDIDLAPFLEPPLTTVAQPKREMGALAVRMILDLLAGEQSAQDRVLPSRLLIRGSTAPPGGSE